MKIKFAVALLFCLCSGGLWGQSYWLWAESVTSTSGPPTVDNTGIYASSDTAGNVFVTGYFRNNTLTFGSTTLTNIDASGFSQDLFVVKYDSAGNVLWARRAGGTGNDVGSSVHVDPTGNVYLAGWFGSPTITFGSTTLTSSGGNDLFLVKLSSNGNVLWAESAGGGLFDQANSVDSDEVGNVFITGAFYDTITFGATTLTGVWDIFIAKYDTNGNLLWARSADGATAHDEGYSISTDRNGNVFVTGEFQSDTLWFGSTSLVNSGGRDIFIAKYDPSGNLLWAKSTDGGTSDDLAWSVSADTIGSAFITGYFCSPTLVFGASTLTTTTANCDVFLAKYDSNGNALWAKSMQGSYVEEGYSVSADAEGNVFVAGEFRDSIRFASTLLIAPQGSNNPAFILKCDAAGNILCSEVLASGCYGSNSIAADPFGNAFLTGGFTLNPFAVGSDILTLTSQSDVFVAKYRCDNAVSINETDKDESISFYPNPSTGTFVLQTSLPGGELSIIDVLGQVVFQSEISSSALVIDLSAQASGIYFANVLSDSKIYSVKLIKY